MEVEGEPQHKRQCHVMTIWYKLNTDQVMQYESTGKLIVELANELHFANTTVKHKGTVLKLDDEIPVTTAGDLLHFITTVRKSC